MKLRFGMSLCSCPLLLVLCSLHPLSFPSSWLPQTVRHQGCGCTCFLILVILSLPPSSCDLQPRELWTGKQIFSVLVRPTALDRIFVTLGTAEKTYSKEGGAFCRNDGFVLFRNSELLAGQLGKATLGIHLMCRPS